MFASPGDTTGKHSDDLQNVGRIGQRLPRSPALSLVHIIEKGRSKWAACKCVSIEKLANLVNMSVTSFHRQFKAVTGMSPSQYQKTLRLQEARRLMLTAMLDAGTARRRATRGAHFSRVRPVLRERA